jgi:hypothetical protein
MKGTRKPRSSQQPSQAQAEAWCKAWKAAGARLEDLRRRKLEKLTTRDVQRTMLRLDGAFKALRQRRKPRKTSGLIELQAWLRRLPR